MPPPERHCLEIQSWAGGGYLQILQFMETFHREHEKSSVAGYYIYIHIYIYIILYVVIYIILYVVIYIYILYVVIYIYISDGPWHAGARGFSCNNRCQSFRNIITMPNVYGANLIHK